MTVKLCVGCGKPTTGICWTDCGMSLCGAPLCGSCTHVDEKWGWRHEPRTPLNDPQHYAGGPDDR